MQDNPKTNFGHGVAETDDFSWGISDDGEGLVIRHDPSGDEWTFGEGGAEVPSIESQELSTKQFPTVDVDAFGAVGDGLTDDSQAIQSAVNSLDSGETGALSFSPGKHYYVGSQIDVPLDKIRTIEGNNAYLETDQDITVLNITGNSTGKSFVSNHNQHKNDEITTPIRNLQIHSTTDPFVGTGIRIENAFSTIVEECHLYNLDTGLQYEGITRNDWQTDNQIYNNRVGLHFGSTHNVHQAHTVDNHFFYNDKSIYANGVDLMDWSLTGNQFEVGTQPIGPTYIIHVEDVNCRGNRAINNNLQDHGGAGPLNAAVRIDITDGSDHERWSWRANDFVNFPDDIPAIEVIGGARYKFTNNIFNRINAVPIQLSQWQNGGGEAARATVTDNDFWDTAGICSIEGSSGVLRPVIVADNTLQTSHVIDSPAISVDTAKTEAIREGRVEDNTLSAPNSSNSAWFIDIGGDSLEDFRTSGNQIYTRGSNPGGVRVNPSTTPNLFIAKDNIYRTSGTAYDFPAAEAGNVIVKDNLDGA